MVSFSNNKFVFNELLHLFNLLCKTTLAKIKA